MRSSRRVGLGLDFFLRGGFVRGFLVEGVWWEEEGSISYSVGVWECSICSH